MSASVCAKVRRAFEAAGWDPQFLESHFESYDMEFETVDYFFENILWRWWSATDPNRSFTQRLKAMGVLPWAARQYAYVVAPLRASLTHDQMLENTLLWMLGRAPFIPNIRLGDWPRDLAERFLPSRREPIHLHFIKLGARFHTQENAGKRIFHATCWQYALDILKNGIDIGKGRRCTDFGLNRGFYASNDIPTALDWARRNDREWNGQLAILAFSWPSQCPRHFKFFEFPEVNEEWKNRVAQSRRCAPYDDSPLDKKDVVYGPMCNNPENVAKGDPATAHFPVKFQWAFKSQRAADYLNPRLTDLYMFAARRDAARPLPSVDA